MLEVLKYQVVTADDGEDAIQQIIDHDATIDAILMDQSLPRKDGFTATREIRAMEEAGTLSRRRPIIVLDRLGHDSCVTLAESAIFTGKCGILNTCNA